MSMAQIQRLTFVDIETTGLLGPSTRKDSIIEVAAAVVDLKTRAVVDQWTTLITPHGDQSGSNYLPFPFGRVDWILGDYHLKAGHFDGVDWSTAMDWDQALKVLGARFLTEGATLAGQNPGFDADHLQRDWSALGWDWPSLDYHRIDLCSPAIFLVMAGLTEGASLRYSAKWAGCGPQRHRAMSDVNDAIRVFWAMADHFTGPKLDVFQIDPADHLDPRGRGHL